MKLDVMKGLNTVQKATTAIIGIAALGVIGRLIYGSIAQVGLSGDVAVPTAVNTSITTQVDTVAGTTGWMVKLDSSTTLALSLLAIVVIMAVFGFIMFQIKGKKGSN